MKQTSKQPRGFRNNNPLNIRKGISRWQGRTIMQDDPDFVTFIDMNMGYRAAWKLMDTYRHNCITLGQKILVVRGDESAYGEALDLDDDGGLLVRFQDGTEKVVSSGEVSVRGMYGYI